MSLTFLLLELLSLLFFISPFTLVGSSTHLSSISTSLIIFFSYLPTCYHMVVLLEFTSIPLIQLTLVFCFIKDSLWLFILRQRYSSKQDFHLEFSYFLSYPNHSSHIQYDVLHLSLFIRHSFEEKKIIPFIKLHFNYLVHRYYF